MTRHPGTVERHQLLAHALDRLLGQVADVHVERAALGNLVDAVAAGDPPQVDRRAVVEARALLRERQQLEPVEDVHGPLDRVHAEPRGGPVRTAPLDVDAHVEHALGLDADVQVGRLAAHDEVADEPALDRRLGAADLLRLVVLLVRARRAGARGTGSGSGEGGEVRHHAEHRGGRALHVVGAAPPEELAVHVRDELLLLARHDVEVGVQDHRDGSFADRRVEDREAVEIERPARGSRGLRASPARSRCRSGCPRGTSCRRRSAAARPGARRLERSGAGRRRGGRRAVGDGVSRWEGPYRFGARRARGRTVPTLRVARVHRSDAARRHDGREQGWDPASERRGDDEATGMGATDHRVRSAAIAGPALLGAGLSSTYLAS